MRCFINFVVIGLVASLTIFTLVSSGAAEQYCQVKGKDQIRMGRSKCPASTRDFAKFLALTKLIRACRFQRKIDHKKLKVTAKLISHEKVMSDGKMVGCVGEWRICTRCELRK